MLGPIALVLALATALGQAATKPVTIQVGDNGFSPASVTIATGVSVVWHNASQVTPHDVQSSTSNWSYDSGPLAPDQTSAAVSFKKAGTYGFTDAVTGAKGTIKVVSSSPSPTPTRTSSSPTPTRTATHKASTPPPSVAPSPSASPTPPPKPTPPPGLPLLVTPPPGASLALPSQAPPPVIAPSKPGSKATAPRALTEPPTDRGFGLPAAVAGLLCLGVVSAQIRIVRAEPVPGDNDEGSVGGLQ